MMTYPSPLLLQCRGWCRRRLALPVRLSSGAWPSRHLPHWQDLALAALGDAADVIGPQCQRRFDFAFVAGAVVDADYSGAVTGLMIENLLDDVRCGAQVAE